MTGFCVWEKPLNATAKPLPQFSRISKSIETAKRSFSSGPLQSSNNLITVAILALPAVTGCQLLLL